MSDVWEVLVKGEVYKNSDPDYEEGYIFDEIEVSVIKIDNEFGHSSYGWGGLDKIIMFDDAIESHKDLYFAINAASILSDGLNKVGRG